jgi:transposase
MIQIEFTSAEIDTLRYEKTYHRNPKVRKRMEALYLKSQKLAHQEICRHVDITRATLATYLKSYQGGGLEALRRVKQYRPRSELEDWSVELKVHFQAHPPRTLAEAHQGIEEVTGLRRSPTQVRACLQRLGMSCRKVGAVPKHTDSEPQRQVQDEFKKKNSNRAWSRPDEASAWSFS